MPELSDWVNIRTGAICFVHIIKIHVGISSRPAGSRYFRRDSMPLVEEKGEILLFSLVKIAKIGPQVLLC